MIPSSVKHILERCEVAMPSRVVPVSVKLLGMVIWWLGNAIEGVYVLLLRDLSRLSTVESTARRKMSMLSHMVSGRLIGLYDLFLGG